ncbi:MAG: hypothetical protein CME68_05665 [Halobacteriovoraceae bacterium]|nr:hypothetical protein [Halobacteriovoraceae bacterium]|tara:strand:+ start:1064 stop:2068 length:1005 start_codon:yes stop_codon:yes gene_type:complete
MKEIFFVIAFLNSLSLLAEKPQINSRVKNAQDVWRGCLKKSVRVGHSIPFVKNNRKVNKLAGILGLQKNFEGADFNPECALDTLYTWQGQWTIDFLNKNMRPDKVFPIPSNKRKETIMFFWRSPIPTFGYGDYNLRIKLKSDVKFLFVGGKRNPCLKLKERKKTVFVRVSQGLSELSEYILCNSSSVDSWSYGTKEHYIEALADLNWMVHKNKSEWEPYQRTSSWIKEALRGNSGFVRLNNNIVDTVSIFNETKTDSSLAKKAGLLDLLRKKYSIVSYSPDVPSKFWSRDSLYKRMLLFYRMSESGKGKVYYSNDNKSKKDHFKTRLPTYFNLD